MILPDGSYLNNKKYLHNLFLIIDILGANQPPGNDFGIIKVTLENLYLLVD
jgi:hypothetical protein